MYIDLNFPRHGDAMDTDLKITSQETRWTST
jgi:hypothetical protein